MRNIPTIAILFFSRSAQAEAGYKSFIDHKQKNRSIHRLLSSHAIPKALPEQVDLIHFDEKRQKGGDFGERISHAFECLYDQGYDKVIAIGNDCPSLHQLNWESICSLESLEEACIGPDFRGGVYLLALHKSQFAKDLFKSLPWRTPTLYMALCQYLEKAGCAYHTLVKMRDLNSQKDLLHYLKASQDALSFLIENLIYPSTTLPHAFVKPVFTSGLMAQLSKRGPPRELSYFLF